MRFLMMAAVAAMLAGGAMASDKFSAKGVAGSLSASGFVSGGQGGSWSVGAMNTSNGFAGVRETRNGVEVSASGGSTSEGFGNNFRGGVAAGGVGGGFGKFSARGRF